LSSGKKGQKKKRVKTKETEWGGGQINIGGGERERVSRSKSNCVKRRQPWGPKFQKKNHPPTPKKKNGRDY